MSGTGDDDLSTLPAIARGADAHGKAALLLVESLIHVLIERSVITVASALDALDTATEANEACDLEFDGPPASAGRSVALLEAIRASLRLDVPVPSGQ